MKLPVLLLLAFAAPALADSCDKANTQTDMTICYGKLAKTSDDALNQAYRALVARWKSDTKAVALLRASERAWIAYRDSECARVGYATTGGSVQPMIIAQCRKDLTDERLKRLKASLTCQEGDLTCFRPGP